MDNEQTRKWISTRLAYLNKFVIGFVLGLLAPIITFLITFFNVFNEYSWQEFFEFLIQFKVLTKLLSLCVLPNLGLFFLFLYPDFMKAARGVLTATFTSAFIIIIIQVILRAI